MLVAGCRTLAPPAPARLAPLLPRLGDLLLVGFHGTAGDDAALERLLCRTRAGGLLLFARNVVDAEQVARLTAALGARARECAGRAPLIAVDAEGGRVMRLGPAAGYGDTLSHQALGAENDLALTELEARRIGGRLRRAGIDWNLAPVVDVGYNPANPVIVGNGRAFGADPAAVVAHARAFIRGMHAAGVLTALKHFPGHGGSFTDSHLGFVDVTDTARPDIELAPYRALMAEGIVDSVMTAHVFNRRLDRRHPATLSRPTITGVLREQLGWRGAVVSDDLRMGAIEQHYGFEDAVVLALHAGVDVLLIADDRLPDDRSAAAVAVAAIAAALESGRLAPEAVEAALARGDALRARRPRS
ncbi:MAG TPA: glycoside hydrolase family 3 N-terminal domain-containing protein [Methylomirabilota bacterium]|nr:glycoside hydrolase family 3 N-terminal domain-containing protein [Methylomirabilota bacterium]